LPLPPLAGNADGFGVAAASQRAGDGATLVLVDVDPHATDVRAATTSNGAKCFIRECR
jgi:NAD(P)-dependent dehydrogenase (short-subunit alcohol dehydrogenase family)